MMKEPEKKEEVDRRQFLRQTAAKAAGVAVVLVAGDTAWVSADTVKDPSREDGEPKLDASQLEYDPAKHSYIFLVDITKCIGCGACVRGCRRENNVPEGYCRTWVERYRVTRSGKALIDSIQSMDDRFNPEPADEEITKAFFVPKLCNHCTLTPCVQLCPVGASYRSPDGVVLVDEDRCIGCAYCVQACPYGSRFLHPVTHTASKCTLCYHRITRGLDTACVSVCPTGARRFGDRLTLGDEVAEIIATHEVSILKPEMYTQPNCYYLGAGKEVR